MEEIYEYEVAFSFAGEDREYVEKVAIFLKKQKITVFYDYFEEENLWGKNLVAYLEEIYTHKSKYCVIFISKYYAQNEWTCYESASAMVRMLENNVKQKEYLLPVKFDETKVAGILGTIGFVDGRKKTPEELGNLIIKKLYGKSKIKNVSLTIEGFKEYLVKDLTTGFPCHWDLTYKETEHEIKFKYSFQNFDYFLNIILEKDENILTINGEYTDVFFDTHTFTPSAKIIFNIDDKIIANGEIINFDFFNHMYSSVLSPFEIIEQIKNEVLKKGGV